MTRKNDKYALHAKRRIRSNGENSSWFNDKKYGEEYRKLLFDRKN